MWKCGKLNASKEDDDEEDTFSEDKAEAIITHSSVASSPLVATTARAHISRYEARETSAFYGGSDQNGQKASSCTI